MHPDRKIGFAMGILLIGIVGALFFRNEPLTTSDVPSIRREQQLNDQLRSRDVAVYLEDRPKSAGTEDDQRNRRWTLRELLEDLDDRNDGVPLPIAVSPAPGTTDGGPLPPLMPQTAPAVDPRGIQSATTRGAAAGGVAERKPTAGLSPADSALPDGNPAASGTPVATLPDPTAAPPDPEDFDEYLVRYGDTLSQIAERFLGSPARFQEIFEINRDRLEAPDRLKVGKAIRIPRH